MKKMKSALKLSSSDSYCHLSARATFLLNSKNRSGIYTIIVNYDYLLKIIMESLAKF